jgi:hypothetical protein
MLVYFTTVRYNLSPFGITNGRLVQFVLIWYTFPVLVCLDQEKSGKPNSEEQACVHRSRHHNYATMTTDEKRLCHRTRSSGHLLLRVPDLGLCDLVHPAEGAGALQPVEDLDR